MTTLTFLLCSDITLDVDISVTCVDAVYAEGGSEDQNGCVSEMLSEQLIKMGGHDEETNK